MANVDLKKTVFNKNQFDKVTGGRDFTTFILQEDAVGLTVQDLFNLYDTLFLTIPVNGETNSHEYLVRRSGELVGFQRTTEDIQPLLNEITSLRQQLLEVQQENVALQIEAAGGDNASTLTQQFTDILQSLSEREDTIIIKNYLDGEESSYTLIEDTLKVSILGTGQIIPSEVSVFENDEIVGDKEITFIGLDQPPKYGQATVIDTKNGTIRYTPNRDAPSGNRQDEFTYKVKDELGVENTGFVYVDIENILATNKPPEVANDVVIVSVDQDGTVNSNSVNVLENDIDPDSNESLFFNGIVSNPKYGSVTVLDSQAGIVQYTPNRRAPSGVKADQFEYKVTDILGGSSTGTVFVNITNNYLTYIAANNDTMTVNISVTDQNNPNSTYTISPETNIINVLLNDDGTDLVFDGITSSPQYGTLTTSEDGTVTYTPRIGIGNPNQIIDLGAFFTPGAGVPQVTSDSFKYRVRNTNAADLTREATVNISINVLDANQGGNLGSSGTSGTSGTEGTSGTSGTEGTSGTSGTSSTSGDFGCVKVDNDIVPDNLNEQVQCHGDSYKWNVFNQKWEKVIQL